MLRQFLVSALCAFQIAAGQAYIYTQHTCTVPASGTNLTDDAPAIRAAFKECGHRGRIVFSPTTYFINSVLDIRDLDDVDIDIQGELLVWQRYRTVQDPADNSHSGVLIFNTGSMRLFPWDIKTSQQHSYSAATMYASMAMATEPSTATATIGISLSRNRVIHQTFPAARIKSPSTP